MSNIELDTRYSQLNTRELSQLNSKEILSTSPAEVVEWSNGLYTIRIGDKEISLTKDGNTTITARTIVITALVFIGYMTAMFGGIRLMNAMT